MVKDKIKTLYINGFQSHINTKIEFCDGLNIIVGPTGSGKSGIIRALELILFNKLEDSNFITLGQDVFKGKVELESGKSITRIKSKKENTYILESDEFPQPMVLTGFGEGPVTEVLNFHGIKPIRIGKKDRFVSVHSQHDQPFFLTETSGDKAKLIGSIAKTDVVDAAIQDLAVDIKREQVKYNTVKANIKAQQDKLGEFGDLEKMRSDFESAQSVLAKIEELRTKDIRISNCLDRMENLLPQYKKLGEIVNRKKAIDNVSELLDFTVSKSEKTVVIRKNLANIDSNYEKVKTYTSIVQKMSEDEILRHTSTLNYLIQNKDQTEKIKSIISNISSLSDRVERCRKVEKSAKETAIVESMIVDVDAKKTQVKLFVTSAASLANEIGRFEKGSSVIKRREEGIREVTNEINAEIEANPVCPTCGSDMTKRKEAVLNA